MRPVYFTSSLLRSSILFVLAVIYVVPVRAQQQKGRTSTGFIENTGQMHDQYYHPNTQARFLLPMAGMNVVLKQNGFSYDTYREDRSNDVKRTRRHPEKWVEPEPRAVTLKFHRIDIEFLGANPDAMLQPEDEAADYLNYYNPVTPEEGARHVRHFSKVTYKNIYPNIDIEFIARPGNNKPVEYNFILHPGARLSDIRIRYSGFNQADCDKKQIILQLAQGRLVETIPSSYWLKNRKEEKISYSIKDKDAQNLTIGFSGIDSPVREMLIIDPTPNLDWATYYGGSGGEVYAKNMIDQNNNIIISGGSSSTNAIATIGSYQSTLAGQSDVVLIKFSVSGTLSWGTYYGGTGDEWATDIITESAANFLIAGHTSSTASISTVGSHQPLYGGGARDGFIAKFDTSGFLSWATYYGGAETDYAYGICTDISNNIIITGNSNSPTSIASIGAYDVTLSGPSFDAFIAKFNNAGVRLWSTYYGGNNTENGNDVETDSGANILVVGGTSSNSGIASPGAHQTVFGGGDDAFLLKLSSSGTRQWATYYGDTGNDWAFSVDIDGADNIYFTGQAGTNTSVGIATVGTQQISPGGNSDAYLAKFNSNGIRQWGTFCGGEGFEFGVDIANVSSGNCLLIGHTTTLNAMATPGAFQTSLGGLYDGFITSYDVSNGTRQWGTYYGSTASDYPNCVSFSSNGNIVLSGYTQSTSGIATVGAHQTIHGGNMHDLFIAKFSTCIGPDIPTIISTSDTICSGSSATLQVNSGNLYSASAWQWYAGSCGGTPVGNGTNISVSPTVNTTYFVRGEGGCISSGPCDSISIIVNPSPALTLAATQTTICPGDPDTVFVTGASSYLWSNSSVNDTIVVSPATTSTYSVTGTAVNGCSDTASITINMHTPPVVTATASQSTICVGETDTLAAAGAQTYVWSTSASTASIIVSPATSTGYSVIGTDVNGCSDTASITVTVNALPVVSANTSAPAVCSGDSVILSGSGAMTYTWTGGVINGAGFVPPVTNTYTVTGTGINGCADTASITVTVNMLPAVSANTSSPAVCSGDSVILSGNGAMTYNWTGGVTNGAGFVPAVTNTYTVTGTDVNSCTGSASVTVIVNPLPVASLTFPIDTACLNGGTIILTGESPAGGIYTGPGVNAGVFDPMQAGLGYNLITYVFIDSNGCSGSATDSIWVDVCNGINTVASSPILIYPNPTTGLVTIEAAMNFISIRVFDALGKEVLSWSPGTSKTELDLGNLPDAVYFIQLNEVNEFIHMRKLILNRN